MQTQLVIKPAREKNDLHHLQMANYLLAQLAQLPTLAAVQLVSTLNYYCLIQASCNSRRHGNAASVDHQMATSLFSCSLVAVAGVGLLLAAVGAASIRQSVWRRRQGCGTVGCGGSSGGFIGSAPTLTATAAAAGGDVGPEGGRVEAVDDGVAAGVEVAEDEEEVVDVLRRVLDHVGLEPVPDAQQVVRRPADDEGADDDHGHLQGLHPGLGDPVCSAASEALLAV